MAYDEGMHSPGSAVAHMLPRAGMRSATDEMYRFHRVIPFHAPDPCIQPLEAELVCLPETPSTKNVADMPPAGMSTMRASDRFAFYKAREGSSYRPSQPRKGQNIVEQPCPCSNSGGCLTGIPAGNFDQRYKGIANKNIIQPIPDSRDCQRLMNSSYSYSPCWPMPNEQGVSNLAKAGPQSQPRQISSSLGPAVEGHRNPTPYSAQKGPPTQTKNGPTEFGSNRRQQQFPDYAKNPYNSHSYICQPVFDLKYLQDCPQQDGPPADSYTFL